MLLLNICREYKQQDDDWEGPFKSRLAAQRASNMGSEHPLASTSPVPPISTKYLFSDDPVSSRQSSMQSPEQDTYANQQFSELKQQIKLEEKTKPHMGSSVSFDSDRASPRTQPPVIRINKELQTSFDGKDEVSSNSGNHFNYNNANNRELVYKSKRSESREGPANNNIFNGKAYLLLHPGH